MEMEFFLQLQAWQELVEQVQPMESVGLQEHYRHQQLGSKFFGLVLILLFLRKVEPYVRLQPMESVGLQELLEMLGGLVAE